MPQHPTRRTLIAAGASALALPALAQPQPSPAPDGALAPNPAALRKAMADFTQGRQPLAQVAQRGWQIGACVTEPPPVARRLTALLCHRTGKSRHDPRLLRQPTPF